MRYAVFLLSFTLGAAAPALAQSLHLPAGTNGVEVSAGWSVGPSSEGLETVVGVSIGGRLDVGVGFNFYDLTFEDGSTSSFEEYAPLVRWFPLKEQSGAPLSLSVNGQLFVDDYGTDDEGSFVQIGTTAYKAFTLANKWAITPFAGFAFVAESYTFGGGEPDRAQYLTRDFGLHFTSPADRAWMLRMTLIEQSFRRETYRGARAAIIRKF
jgi:hypothetical protein